MAQSLPTRTNYRFDSPGEALGEEARRRLPMLVQYPSGAECLAAGFFLMPLLRGLLVLGGKDWTRTINGLVPTANLPALPEKLRT